MNQLVYFDTIREMQSYARERDLSLFVYKKVVYNLTDYLSQHYNSEFTIREYENSDITNILFNKSIYKHQPDVISFLQNYQFGFIERRETPCNKFKIKSSKLIIEQTRKLLQESTEPIYEAIPDDCSIKELPILRIHSVLHSHKTIPLTQ